jgi:hypothetical protein
MNYYNIYYKGKKLNNRPLTNSDVDEIKEKKEIYKRNNLTNKLDRIPVNSIQYVKTILI